MDARTQFLDKKAVLWFIDTLHLYLPTSEQERLADLRQQFQALPDHTRLSDCLWLFLVLDDLCWVAMPRIAPSLQSIH